MFAGCTTRNSHVLGLKPNSVCVAVFSRLADKDVDIFLPRLAFIALQLGGPLLICINLHAHGMVAKRRFYVAPACTEDVEQVNSAI